MNTPKINDTVKRLAKDYTNGRTGSVIELDTKKGRARIHWTSERNGEVINIRTWVRFQDLQIITEEPASEPAPTNDNGARGLTELPVNLQQSLLILSSLHNQVVGAVSHHLKAVIILVPWNISDFFFPDNIKDYEIIPGKTDGISLQFWIAGDTYTGFQGVIALTEIHKNS
jgi:hypothetical protein